MDLPLSVRTRAGTERFCLSLWVPEQLSPTFLSRGKYLLAFLFLSSFRTSICIPKQYVVWFYLREDYKNGIILILSCATSFYHLALCVEDLSLLLYVALVHFHCLWICLSLFMHFLVNEPSDWFPFFGSAHLQNISGHTLDHLFWYL